MKIAGIIAEYNPFHAGHLYHIQETKARTQCDYVVAVMDGAFTQRGEMALTDKFSRAACAIEAGVDAVFELPAVYAVRPAQHFARGGVEILNALNVDFLSFGCETDDLAALLNLRDLLYDEPEPLKELIREGLREGKTLARARGEAVGALTGVNADLFSQPNIALGLEYLKSLRALHSSIEPLVIRRTAPYHGGDNDWSSASTLRRAVHAGKTAEALAHLPECVRARTQADLEKGISNPGFLNDLTLYVLRNMPLSQAEALPDSGEGLAGRLLTAANGATSYEELVSLVKCKRYTRARITRLIAAALLNLPATPPETLPYLRLIGFRRDARPLLTELSRRATLPISSDPARLESDPSFAIEKRATDLWGLSTANPHFRRPNRDLTEKFLII